MPWCARPSDEQVSDDVVRAIHGRAEGNPFFMTELARLFAADPQLTEGEVVRRIGVPAGVRDVVHRRLAHLAAPTVDVLQMAAVLGPLAEAGLLAAAMGITIDDCLDRLEPALEARLLLEADNAVGAVRFSHGLVGEVLLDDMSALRRARLHLRAAEAIEARSHRRADVAQIVAEHLWSAASVAPPERVADGLEEAAMVAAGRYALEQADELLARALQVRRTLPAERHDVGAELALISRLAAVRRARYGFDEAIRQTDVARVRELAPSVDELRPVVDVLWTEWSAVVTSGRIIEGRGLLAELLAVTRRTEDPLVIAVAAFAWGVQCWHEGRMTEAVEALDRAALNFAAVAEMAPDVLNHTLVEHHALSTGFRLIAHELAGDPLDRRTLAPLIGPSTPYQQVATAVSWGLCATYAGDWPAALRLTEDAMALGVDAFGFFMSAAHALHGIALIGQGDAAPGVAELDQGLAMLDEDGAGTCVPYYWSWQVRGRLLTGDVDGAVAALRRAEQVVADTAELWNRPFVLAAGAALAHAAGSTGGRGRPVAGRRGRRGHRAGHARDGGPPGGGPARARAAPRLTNGLEPTPSRSPVHCKRAGAR